MDEAKMWERLGELTAEGKASRNQRADLFTEVGDIKTMIADLTVVVQTSITKGDARLTEVEEDLVSQGKAIGELKKFKQRMLIGIAAIGGTGGIIGGLTTGLLKKLGMS